jgi:aryl-alcohol dehydrogenase-like predicted oxidoreductase
VAYSPLGRGFLTGRFKSADDLPSDDVRRNHPRFQGDNFVRNLDLVKRVESIAARKECTPGQLALAWLFAQGGDIVPIPGTTRRSRLEENIRALEVSLTDTDLTDLQRAAPKGATAGTRYPAPAMAAVNR